MVLESSAQEVASMFKGKRRLWRNKAGGATAMVAEEVLIRQGEFHVWMWLEKTSAGSDVLHTWSGVKNNNIRRLHWNDTKWRCEGASSIPETYPGAKILKNAAWNFSACVSSCWRFTLAVLHWQETVMELPLWFPQNLSTMGLDRGDKSDGLLIPPEGSKCNSLPLEASSSFNLSFCLFLSLFSVKTSWTPFCLLY